MYLSMIDNEELVDIKRVIRSRKFMNRPKVMGQKYKQCYSKHYTENQRSTNTNPTGVVILISGKTRIPQWL